jgi:hypothetical protein
MRRTLAQAGLTGAFCVVFALGLDAALDALPAAAVLFVPFLSGFLGSLFAQTVLRGERERR